MISAILYERRDLCRSLAELSAQQRRALTERDYDALIRIAGEKGKVLDRLAALAPPVRDAVDKGESLSSEERDGANLLLDESNRLLESAAEAERDAIAELVELRDATQQELREIAAAGKVHSAYRDALAPVTHRSLDIDR